MTCIVGIAEKGKVYIGGDSAGVAGYSVQIRADQKVFRNGPFVMGFTSSFRMGQLLRYCFTPPDRPEGIEDMSYMVSHFVPALQRCFKDGGFETEHNSQKVGGCFLVGYKGILFEIEDDYQVACRKDNLCAVGCGAEFALGVLHALPELSPKERITKALEVSAYLSTGVRPPFVIEEC